MLANLLLSESFSSSQNRHYFLDFKRTAKDSKFLQISRSDQKPDGSYHLDEEGKTVQDMRKEKILQERRGIPGWDTEKKPREKLFEHGLDVLSDSELLAILIGSGTPGEDAVALCDRMLISLGGFEGLVGREISTLSSFNGIGPAKAATIIAVMGIAERLFQRRV